MPNWKKVIVSGSDAALNNITATGNVNVQGDLIAERYIISSSVSHITQSFSSGSTVFGDTNDDTHQFTGSLFVSGNLTLESGSITVKGVSFTGVTSSYISSSLAGNVITYNQLDGNTHTIDLSSIVDSTADNDWYINTGLGYISTSLDVLISGTLDVSESITTQDLNLLGDGSPEIIADGPLVLSSSNVVIVSASSLSVDGLLFASLSANPSPTTDKVVHYDTATQEFYYFDDKYFGSITTDNTTLTPAWNDTNLGIFSGSDDNISVTGVPGANNISLSFNSSGINVTNLTSSNNISGSGDLSITNDAYIGGNITGSNISGSGNLQINNITSNNITSSGDISASGYIYADRYYLNNTPGLSYSGDTLRIAQSSWGTIGMGNVNTNTRIEGNLTASKNISASGHLFASTSNAGTNPYLTVLIDTASGQFYYTGSYGGGGNGSGIDNDWLTVESGSNNNDYIRNVSSSNTDTTVKVVIASASVGITDIDTYQLFNVVSNNPSTSPTESIGVGSEQGLLITNTSIPTTDKYSNIDFRIGTSNTSNSGRISYQRKDVGTTNVGEFQFIVASGSDRNTALRIKGDSNDIVLSGSITASLPNAPKTNAVYYDTTTGGFSYDIAAAGGSDTDWYDGGTIITSSVKIAVSGNVLIPQGEGYFKGNGEELYNVPAPLDWDGNTKDGFLTKLIESKYLISDSLTDNNLFDTSSLILSGSGDNGQYPVIYFNSPGNEITPFSNFIFSNLLGLGNRVIAFTSSHAGNQLGATETAILNAYVTGETTKLIDLADIDINNNGTVSGGEILQAVVDLLKENQNNITWNDPTVWSYNFTDLYNVNSSSGKALRKAIYSFNLTTPDSAYIVYDNIFNIDFSSSLANQTTQSYADSGKLINVSNVPNIIYQNLNTDLDTTISGSFKVTGSIEAYGNLTIQEGNISLESGNITASGDISASNIYGTLQTAAQPNITSLGNLTSLTVDDININESNIISETDPNVFLILNNSGIFFDANTGDNFYFNQNQNDVDFQIYSQNDENLIYGDASTDKVGIGTESPGEKLEVIGNISASGNIFANTNDAAGASYNTLMVNTATGQFFHTGSYGSGGGGGSGTVTEVTVGTGLDVTNGTTTPNVTLNLSEVGFTGTANGLITSNNDGTVTTESTLIYNGTLLTLDGSQTFTPGTANNGILTRADNQWESTTLESSGEYIQVGTAIPRTQHHLYNLGSSGWAAANAGSTSTSTGFLGVAIDGTTDSDFLIRGVFNILGTNVTNGGIGKTVYVSTTSGEYTCTAPSSPGDVVRAVGHIIDSFVSGRSTYWKIYFNPSLDYIEN